MNIQRSNYGGVAEFIKVDGALSNGNLFAPTPVRDTHFFAGELNSEGELNGAKNNRTNIHEVNWIRRLNRSKRRSR